MKKFVEYLNEAYVNTDQVDTHDVLSMLRGALVDEASAVSLYNKIIDHIDNGEVVEVITEIKSDEQQHMNLLNNLLLKLDDSQKEALKKSEQEFPALTNDSDES